MNLNVLIIGLLWIIGPVSSCTSNQTKQIKSAPHNCVMLNDSAFKYISLYNFDHSSKNLDTAIFLLKKAIACDTNYFVAYSNLANAYDLVDNYKDEIQTLNRMIAFNHNNNWWVLTRIGLTYQKLKDINSAKKIYQSVDSLCSAKIKQEPKNVLLITNYINFKIIAYGQAAGKQELSIQIKKHPELKSKIIVGVNL